MEDENDGSTTFKILAHSAYQSLNLLYNEKTTEVRKISNLFDRVQLNFIQFGDILKFLSGSPQKYRQLLPINPCKSMVETFKISPEQAFFILRPSLDPIHEWSNEELSKKAEEFSKVYEYWIEQNGSDPLNENEYFNSKSFVDMKLQSMWKVLNSKIYLVFWALRLQDIFVPTDIYNERFQANREQIKKSENSSSKKKEADKLKKSYQQLNNEMDKQIERKKMTLDYLQENKEEIFKMPLPTTNTGEISINFVMNCVYPRIKFSPADAIYSVKFIKLI